MAEPESGRFRSALGGFNRLDVAQYIEQMAREHREQMEALQAQLEQVRKEKAALAEELEGARSQSGDLADQEAQTRASLDESTRSLTCLRGELQVTQGHLTMAKKELSDLQAKVARLEPLAQQYEGLKDRVATVELDAHRKAQATVEEAQAQARLIRQEAAQWVADLSGSYEALRAEVDSYAQQAQQARQSFVQREDAFRDLLRRVGQTEEEP